MRLIFGGSFDPVHVGHLRILRDLAAVLGQREAYLMPCKAPVHKAQTRASVEQRLAMLNLVARQDAFYCIDTRELVREGPSYMLDSLHSLRTEQPEESFVLVMGSDSALSLDTWHGAEQLSSLCHIAILQRPGISHDDLEQVLAPLGFGLTSKPEYLIKHRCGLALDLKVQQLDVSSSNIRERVSAGDNIRYLVPDAVWEYICDNSLYIN